MWCENGHSDYWSFGGRMWVGPGTGGKRASSRLGRSVCGGQARVLIVGTRILTLTLGLVRHH